MSTADKIDAELKVISMLVRALGGYAELVVVGSHCTDKWVHYVSQGSGRPCSACKRTFIIKDAPAGTDHVGRSGQLQSDRQWPETT